MEHASLISALLGTFQKGKPQLIQTVSRSGNYAERTILKIGVRDIVLPENRTYLSVIGSKRICVVNFHATSDYNGIIFVFPEMSDGQLICKDISLNVLDTLAKHTNDKIQYDRTHLSAISFKGNMFRCEFVGVSYSSRKSVVKNFNIVVSIKGNSINFIIAN